MDSNGESGECCVHVFVSGIHEHWGGGDGTDGGEDGEMRHSFLLAVIRDLQLDLL